MPTWLDRKNFATEPPQKNERESFTEYYKPNKPDILGKSLRLEPDINAAAPAGRYPVYYDGWKYAKYFPDPFR